MKEYHVAQFMVRLRSQQRPHAEIVRALEACGMEVDRAFGVVNLDAAGESVLARGKIDETAAQQLRTLGAELFPDMRIGPAAST